MRRLSTTTVVETPLASNRRQPIRQTRTNPPRGVANVAQPQHPGGAPKVAGQTANLGFFPAITHFTDSITALPKELIRNYTMLKEVDAKIYGPEELLGQLIKGVLDAPTPPRKTAPLTQNREAIRSQNGRVTKVRTRETDSSPATASETSNSSDVPRRQLVMNLRMVMNDMLGTLDEKNHVISNAVDELNKQLARCDSSFAHILNEVSEEAQHGSLNHWAYTEKAAEKKGTLAGERTRRDTGGNNQAFAGANQETEGVASRSEMRREALAARKRPNNHLDSDFDDGRSPAQTSTRKAQANGKSRKPPDLPMINGAGIGLGIANGLSSAVPANKKRKVEKPAVITPIGGIPMERAMSSVYGSNIGSTRGVVGSPRETPAVEAAKKRGRAAGGANGNTRRRANTNNSAADSPLIASSPIAGTFPVTKDLQRKSPAPVSIQRAQPSRARQNSAQSMLPDIRNGSSSSTFPKTSNKNGIYGTTVESGKFSIPAGRSIPESKTTMKESLNLKSEQPVEEIMNNDGAGELRGTSAGSSGRTADRALKREEPENGTGKARPDRPPSVSISTRGGVKPSKPIAPHIASVSEPPPRCRSSRAIEIPVKRSHKKGAGLAAQLAAAEAARVNHIDEEGSSIQGEEEEEEEGEEEEYDGSEPRYCYCNGVSYGEMVACDMENCQKEWFHLGCVGLVKAPTKNAKWFCDDCLKNKAKTSTTTPTASTASPTAITAGR